MLTSVAYVHLKEYDISKHTRNLAPASKAILLSGPAEFYQQMLAKALSHYFESKLLLLDITDFSIKVNQSMHVYYFPLQNRIVLDFFFLSIIWKQIQSKYGCTKREPVSYYLYVFCFYVDDFREVILVSSIIGL